MSYEWYCVASCSDEKLAANISAALTQNNIRHDVRGDTSSFEIYINEPHKLAHVKQLLVEFRHQSSSVDDEGTHAQPVHAQPDSSDVSLPTQHVEFLRWHHHFLTHPSKTPVTLLFIFLGIVGYISATYFQRTPWFFNWVYLPFELTSSAGEYWRMLTPTFLHFGEVHIVFNALWIWVFGSRIEVSTGSFKTLSLFVVVSVGANVAQAQFTPNTLFGGLSGLVYGLLGFLLVRHFAKPHSMTYILPSVSGMLIFFMVLSVLGVVDFIFGINVANSAHVAGFCLGLLCAVICYLNPLRERFLARE